MEVFQRIQQQDHAGMKVLQRTQPGWYQSIKTVLLNSGTRPVCPKVDTYSPTLVSSLINQAHTEGLVCKLCKTLLLFYQFPYNPSQ
jgi:hypothetical protein